MNKQKGFTIIELIVVIAIIAILAGIVLVNVTQYINKAKDASVAGNLGSMQTAAQACYSDTGACNSDYTKYNTSPYATGYLTSYTTIVAAIAAQDTNTAVSNFTSSAFCYSIPLNVSGAGSWCVDSTGFSGSGSKVCNTTSHTCS